MVLLEHHHWFMTEDNDPLGDLSVIGREIFIAHMDQFWKEPQWVLLDLNFVDDLRIGKLEVNQAEAERNPRILLNLMDEGTNNGGHCHRCFGQNVPLTLLI